MEDRLKVSIASKSASSENAHGRVNDDDNEAKNRTQGAKVKSTMVMIASRQTGAKNFGAKGRHALTTNNRCATDQKMCNGIFDGCRTKTATRTNKEEVQRTCLTYLVLHWLLE
jgi:hypothetical protein